MATLPLHFNHISIDSSLLKKRGGIGPFKGTNHPTANVSALQELGLGGQRFQQAPRYSLI
jgi:hypothetical protein